jgi:hypothetical protein
VRQILLKLTRSAERLSDNKPKVTELRKGRAEP